MFGVVLWSDCAEHKAVIWCEDHGELAYFDAADDPGSRALTLEAGDLVRFDVKDTGRMRRVRNTRLVAERQYPSLATDLKAAEPAPEKPAPAVRDHASAVVISFVAERRRRNDAAPVPAQRLTVV